MNIYNCILGGTNERSAEKVEFLTNHECLGQSEILVFDGSQRTMVCLQILPN